MSLQDIAHKLDPVLWVHTLGFLPHDEEGRPGRLDLWQQDLLRDDKHRYMILNIHRQTGKSLKAAIMAVHRAIYFPPSLVLLLSPTLRWRKHGERRGLFGHELPRANVAKDIKTKAKLHKNTSSF